MRYDCPRCNRPGGSQYVIAGRRDIAAGYHNVVAGNRDIVTGSRNVVGGIDGVATGSRGIVAGSHEVAQQWKQYLQNLGIDHRRTTLRHPQSNGRVERFNRTFKEMLTKFVNNETANWVNKIADVLMAYRSSVSSVTGYTPFYLLIN